MVNKTHSGLERWLRCPFMGLSFISQPFPWWLTTVSEFPWYLAPSARRHCYYTHVLQKHKCRHKHINKNKKWLMIKNKTMYVLYKLNIFPNIILYITNYGILSILIILLKIFLSFVKFDHFILVNKSVKNRYKQAWDCKWK